MKDRREPKAEVNVIGKLKSSLIHRKVVKPMNEPQKLLYSALMDKGIFDTPETEKCSISLMITLQTLDKFIDYLKNVLAPTLHEGDIVVMDNMRTHHSNAVREVIEELKINVIFLSPYSPDFNPIEKMWSKIKSVLRTLKIRDLNLLSDAIEYAFSCVTSSDCYVWFCSVGIV